MFVLLSGAQSGTNTERRGAVVAAALAVVLTCASCAESGERLPMLLTAKGQSASVLLPARGTLQVSPEGCFMLGNRTLVATRGSTVLEGGSGVETAGVGTFTLGQEVNSPRLVEGGREGSFVEQLRGHDQCGDFGLAVFLDPR